MAVINLFVIKAHLTFFCELNSMRATFRRQPEQDYVTLHKSIWAKSKAAGCFLVAYIVHRRFVASVSKSGPYIESATVVGVVVREKR